MSDAPLTLYEDLMKRLSDIDKGIDLTDFHVALDSYPNYYTNANKPPFPKTLHKIARLQSMVGSMGLPFMKETLTVSKLLVAGPVGAGYMGESEALAYRLVRPILNTYYANPTLAYPTSENYFPYLVAGERVRISAPNGTAIVKFDPESKEAFFVLEFFLEMSFLVKQGRIA